MSEMKGPPTANSGVFYDSTPPDAKPGFNFGRKVEVNKEFPPVDPEQAKIKTVEQMKEYVMKKKEMTDAPKPARTYYVPADLLDRAYGSPGPGMSPDVAVVERSALEAAEREGEK